jgi:ABC-type transport system substrate-binding protein
MKFKIIVCVLLGFLVHPSSFGQKAQTNKLIVGTWNYVVAYDTIAPVRTNGIVDTSTRYPVFISRLKIKDKEAVLFNGSKKLKATWEINDNKEITFSLRKGGVFKYLITSLTPVSLELRELAPLGSTSGYKMK